MKRLWILLLVSILVAPYSYGQSAAGTLSGTVRDETGALIPGVSVTITNTDTGLTRAAVTDDQGRYRAVALSLGLYEVKAELVGFQTSLRQGITLTVATETVVHLTLSIGELTSEVVVQGEAPLVNTKSATLGALVDAKKIRDLPLNGRSYDQLALLQPGVVMAKRQVGGGITGGHSTFKLSIAGSRPNENAFLLDGTDVTDYRGGTPGSVAGQSLGTEAIREFRVLTNNYSAEYGRASGGVVTTVSRSGTNAFHGSLFEFHRNDNLDARNFFDPADQPEFKRNQFGFAVGGPIIQNQTFFFVNYEGLRERLGISQRATVPGEDLRAGPVAAEIKPYLDLYPPVNTGVIFGDGTGHHVFGASQPTDEDYVTGRIDHSFSDNHTVFGRYTLTDSEVVEPLEYPFTTEPSEGRNQYVTLENKNILSPRWLNTFRVGFARTFVIEDILVEGVPEALDWVPGHPLFVSSALDVRGLDEIGLPRIPRWFAFNQYEFSDDINYTQGRHSLKFGFVGKRIQLNSDATNRGGGEFEFKSVNDFLTNDPDEFIASLPGLGRHRNWRQSSFGFYLQDDLEVAPNLAVNLGVRWEFTTSPNEVNGKAAKLPDPTQDETIQGNPLFETSKATIAPRVGLAWDPSGDGKMALRAGFGIFFDQPYAKYWFSPGRAAPPFFKVGTMDSGFTFPDAWDELLSRAEAGVSTEETFQTVKEEQATAYSMQFNLTLQREVLPDTVVSLGYAGNLGRKAIRAGNTNTSIPEICPAAPECAAAGRPDGSKFFTDRADRLNEFWGKIRLQTTDANSTYHGLQAALNKRFSNRLQLQGSYTLSKAMSIQDNISGGEFVGSNLVMDVFDPGLDWAPAAYDTRHNFVFNYTYACTCPDPSHEWNP